MYGTVHKITNYIIFFAFGFCVYWLVFLKDASDNLSKAVIGTIASENRSRINQELSKVVGLTIKERHKATKLIVCQHELIDVFFSVPDEEKEEWVKGLINGDF